MESLWFKDARAAGRIGLLLSVLPRSQGLPLLVSSPGAGCGVMLSYQAQRA